MCHRKIEFIGLISLFLLFIFIQPIKAETDLEAMKYMLLLAQNHLIKIHLDEPESGLYVEPKLWQKMTHHNKVIFMQNALSFFRQSNELQHKNTEWVGVFDMTSHSTLGSIDLTRRKFRINK